ncbi:HD domain-containing protein, partial [Clostridium faecium]
MFIYRVKQFFKAITAKITEEDIEFFNRYLKPFEIELFNKLKVYDKKHCINVAKDIFEETKRISLNDYDTNTLIKAGLLHDIGKVYRSLNPIEKSIVVILNFITGFNIYLLMGSLTKRRLLKFLGVVLYLFNGYHILDLYVRVEWGEV